MVISGGRSRSNVKEDDLAKFRSVRRLAASQRADASVSDAGPLVVARSTRVGVRTRTEVERIFSDEASEHIHQLVRLGWKQKEIAAVAGVAPRR